MRETIRTSDADLYVGWPTTSEDLERDASVQVGVRYGDFVAWAVLTNPDQLADYRRTLQRAGHTVRPREAELVVPSPFGPVATGLVTPATDEPA